MLKILWLYSHISQNKSEQAQSNHLFLYSWKIANLSLTREYVDKEMFACFILQNTRWLASTLQCSGITDSVERKWMTRTIWIRRYMILLCRLFIWCKPHSTFWDITWWLGKNALCLSQKEEQEHGNVGKILSFNGTYLQIWFQCNMYNYDWYLTLIYWVHLA